MPVRYYPRMVSASYHPILVIVLYILAVPRATRLFTRDIVPCGALRERFVNRWGVYVDAVGEERKKSIGEKPTNWFMRSLATLWECDWCASVWFSGILGWLAWNFSEVMVWVFAGLIASWLAGWSAILEKYFISHTVKE